MAAALFGADRFNAPGRSHIVGALSIASLVLWTSAILLLVWALAVPSRPDRRSIPVKVAIGVGFAAFVLTIVNLSLLGTRFGSDRDSARVVLARANRAAIDKLCGTSGRNLDGQIPTGTLDGVFVVLQLPRSTSTECDAVRIPATAILAIQEHPHKKSAR